MHIIFQQLLMFGESAATACAVLRTVVETVTTRGILISPFYEMYISFEVSSDISQFLQTFSVF